MARLEIIYMPTCVTCLQEAKYNLVSQKNQVIDPYCPRCASKALKILQNIENKG